MELAILLAIGWVIFLHAAPIIALLRSARIEREKDELKDEVRHLSTRVKILREDFERMRQGGTVAHPPTPPPAETPAIVAKELEPELTIESAGACEPLAATEETKQEEETPRAPILPPPLPVMTVNAAAPEKPEEALVLPPAFARPPGTGAESSPVLATESEHEEKLAFEARVGGVWALRIALVLFAIAAAYLSRLVSHALTPWMKTALAYAGAFGLFGVGKYFEEKLKQFAQPVMAGGLAIAFFVSFAAHFIPPMRCVSLPVSIGLMCAGVGAIFHFANQWKSQYIAGLAIFLGHVAAFVGAKEADTFSLVIIAFLSASSVFMFHRHSWSSLSLFGAVSAYVSHLLWGWVEPVHGTPEMTFWLNFIFLSSYYVIFTTSDLLWWARTQDTNSEAASRRDPAMRAMAPVNFVAYVSIITFLYIRSEPFVGSIEWYFFAMAAAQGALAWKHRRYGNPDWAVYPALGTIFLTVGLFNALGSLTLNMVLAAEAVILLIAAHRTRLWVFHALAQAAMTLNFFHYWIVQGPSAAPDVKVAAMIGGLMVAGVYFLKSQLEEIWYGGGALPWHEADGEGRRGPITRALAGMLDEFFGPAVPLLAHAHATAGGVMIIHQLQKNMAVADSATAAAFVMLALVIFAIIRRSVPMMWGYLASQAGLTLWIGFNLIRGSIAGRESEVAWTELWMTCAGWLAPLGIVLTAPRWMRTHEKIRASIMLGNTGGALTMLAAWVFVLASPAGQLSDGWLILGWAAAIAIVFVHRDLLRGWIGGLPETICNGSSGLANLASAACCAATVLLSAVTLRYFGQTTDAVYCLTVWVVVLLAAGGARRDAILAECALIMLTITHVVHYLAVPAMNVSAAPAATLWLVALTLALATALDYFLSRGADKLNLNHLNHASNANYYLYALGLGLASVWLHTSFSFPVSSLLIAAVAVALGLEGGAAGFSRAIGASYALMLAALGHGSFMLMTHSPESWGGDPLMGILAILVLACAYERILTHFRRGRPKVWNDDTLPALRGFVLLPAVVLALVGIYVSPMLGPNHRLATAGWGALGVALMIAGFAFRSPMYRRTALALLAVCLGRVFLVDTRELNETFKMIAFFALGVCLLGVAWLYSRFAKDIKKWL